MIKITALFAGLFKILGKLGLVGKARMFLYVAAKKYVFMAISLTLVTFVLLALGLLPPSPFRSAFAFLFSMQAQIPYLRYIAVFIPVVEITATLYAWILAIVGWYTVKVILKKVGIIS